MREGGRRAAAVLLGLGGFLVIFLDPGFRTGGSLWIIVVSFALGVGVSALGTLGLFFSILIWRERERDALHAIARTVRPGGWSWLVSQFARPGRRDGTSWGEALRTAKLFGVLAFCMGMASFLSIGMGWLFWYDLALFLGFFGLAVYYGLEVELGIDLYRRTPLT